MSLADSSKMEPSLVNVGSKAKFSNKPSRRTYYFRVSSFVVALKSAAYEKRCPATQNTFLFIYKHRLLFYESTADFMVTDTYL